MAHQSEIEKLERRYEEKPSQWFAALAEEYRRSGDVDRALEIVRRGLEERSGYVSGHIVLARCLLQQDNDEEAERVLEQVLELDSENIIALKVLSEIKERANDTAGAVGWLEKLLEVDPMNQDAQDTLERLRAAESPAEETEAATPPAPEVDQDDIPTEKMAAVDATEKTDVAAVSEPAGNVDEVDSLTGREPAGLSASIGKSAEAETVSPADESPPESVATEPPLAEKQDIVQPEARAGDVAAADVPVLDRIPPDPEVEPAEQPSVEEAPLEPAAAEPELPEPISAFDFHAVPAGATSGRADQAPQDSVAAIPETPVATPPETVPTHVAEAQPEPPTPEPVPPDPEVEPAELPSVAEVPLQPAAAEPELPEPISAFDFDAVPAGAPSGRADQASQDSVAAIPETPVATPPETEPTHAAEAQPEPPPPEPVVQQQQPTPASPEPVTPPDGGVEAAEGVATEPEPVVTETMAEVYVSQGLFAEARQVYQQLAAQRPDDATIKVKLTELDEKAAATTEAATPTVHSAAATGGVSAREFLAAVAAATGRGGGGAPPSAAPPESVPSSIPPEPTPLESAFEAAKQDEVPGAPTRPATDDVSLADVFETEPAPPSETPDMPAEGNTAPDVSFDQFYGGSPQGGGGGPDTPAKPGSTTEGKDAEPEDQGFKDWIKGLRS